MNFELQPEDTKYLAELCVKARKKAKNTPAGGQPADEFGYRFGPWNISCTIDLAKDGKKMWHGSVACLDEVGTRPVQFESGLIAQVPSEALVAVSSWEKDIRDAAEFLLGELLGPEIKKSDQPVNSVDGLFALHWITPVA